MRKKSEKNLAGAEAADIKNLLWEKRKCDNYHAARCKSTYQKAHPSSFCESRSKVDQTL